VRGLYIHIPFCAKKCSYCDFYSLTGRSGSIESYIEAVLHESYKYAGLSFQTLYLGGGTPSLVGAENLAKLVAGIKEPLDLAQLVESTIEVNPESATGEVLEAAQEAGINRVSIGVQSLSDYELQSVGRIHSAAQAVEAVKKTITLGFNSISVDLMIGLPGQSWSTLSKALEKVVSAGIGHISLYCLSLEEGTPLEKSPPADLPSEDMQAGLFEQARSFLLGCGFEHYEVSNFALSGYQCLHNLNYWRGGEYVGLGPAAASHLDGKRFRNRADLDGYIERPDGIIEDVEELNPSDKASEEAMLRLRLLAEGLDVSELAAKFGQDNVAPLVKRLDRMAGDGLLVFDGLRYRLPTSRILTSNPIFAEVL
jgi:oxygen-independent coproporphyrinogen III oxidase